MPLKTNDDGVTWPASAESNVIATSGYGMRVHPVLGVQRFHAGIDFVIQGDGGRVRSVAGGEVVLVNNDGDGGGFGNFVVVRTGTGHLEQYNHLDSTAVRVGDVVPPGQSIGVMGSTGMGTGAHVDMMVYNPGTPIDRVARGGYQETTMNPIDYMREVRHVEQRQLGVGPPPSQAPEGIVTNPTPSSWADAANLYHGWITTPTVAVESQTVYNNANPVVNGRASISRADYPDTNNIEHNYGYGQLKADADFRMALVRVANKHNIPAQWLADVMQFESGFNVRAGESTWRSGNSGIGLIQFYTGGGLAEVAQGMGGVSEETAAYRLMNMTPAEQMEWVDFYLSQPHFSDGFHTIEDLLAAVFGGAGLYNKSPSARRNIGDINITFGDYVARLGNAAGRRYQTSYDQAIGGYHYQRVNGCPTCNSMINGQGMITPHRGGR